jgi:plastocyanin
MNRLMATRRLAVLLVATLLGCACSSAEQSKGTPAGSSTARAGRIRGVVRLEGNPPERGVEPITQDQATCGTSVSLPRLALGKSNGVKHAFVYLDGVQSVQEFRPREPVLVDQNKCQYVPHALVVPTGTKLEITNSDPILHNVHGQQAGEDGLQTLFNIAQPVRGQHTPVDQALTKPGIVLLSCEAGHPWMNAYVFVANHPYVAVTADNGEFVIADVPAGTYRIKMWHEGVTLKRYLKSLQRYEYEDPYEITQEVVVQPGADAVVNFDLALRPAT